LRQLSILVVCEDLITVHRYVTIARSFKISNVAHVGNGGNGTTILLSVPNTSASGSWVPAEMLTWLVAGATLPAKFAIGGIGMTW
jgi:hypothetical protein